nr:16S rRNA (cytosine(967)-C(5))-methyltransferase RsmB [Lachnospiraceae bacterium]
LASKKGFSSLKGFVNGVLRNIARDMDNITYPDEGTPEGLSVKFSCPLRLVDQLISEQGYDRAVKMLEASVEAADIYIRVNTGMITPEKLADELKASGLSCEKAPYLPYALRLKDVDSINRIPAFEKGLFIVQDLGSMLVTELSGIKKGDTVFDVCAAPGGKTLHALSKLDGTGHVYSFDISENKLLLIRDNISRAGFSNVDVTSADALVYNAEYEKKADVLIADLPCSGLGVLKRKNDIKYNMTPEKEASLASLQWEMLKNVSRYVKPGGIMVFSTCTVHRAENEENFARIRDELPFVPLPFYDDLPDELKCDTAKEGYIQLLPGVHECDGFFISRFLRKDDDDRTRS